MKELDANAILGTVRESKKIVLVDFFAPWCGPCKAMTPLLEEIEPQFSRRVDFVKTNLDADSDGRLGAELGIKALPTFILFKDGAQIARKVGQQSKADLSAWLNENL